MPRSPRLSDRDDVRLAVDVVERIVKLAVGLGMQNEQRLALFDHGSDRREKLHARRARLGRTGELRRTRAPAA